MILTSGAHAAEAGPAKRVLMVHSFGSTAPPFTTHSTAFETTLTQEMGKRIDLDQVSLDMARYAQPDMEEPFVEFLLKRLAKWSPDLVVPIGSPAGRFVAKYRDRLFPQTPVIYTGMDIRTLPPGSFQNASFVGESFNLGGLVEDILQVTPHTNHIAVVLGASPLERYWTVEFRRAFEPFTNRVRFTWFNDLTFDQMLERVAKLPPRSFILIGLLLRDASGVTHNQDDALQRLHAVANAPINGMYQHQLGLGIVGGRLYHAEIQGAESARIAIRILRGEPAASFPPLIVPEQAPRYDWRELQRWNISAGRLPPGSEIAFRQPTVWERYRWWLVGALVIFVAQAAMIASLMLQRARRRRAETELSESQQLMQLATNAGELGLWSRDLVKGEVWANPALRTLFGFSQDEPLHLNDLLVYIHPDDQTRVAYDVENAQLAGMPFEAEFRITPPNGSERWVVARGKTVSDPRGVRNMGVILDITDRKRAEERFRLAVEASPNAIVMVDGQGKILLVNALTQELFGYSRKELIGQSVEILVPERFRAAHPAHRAAFFGAPEARAIGRGRELLARRKDGTEFLAEIGLNSIETPVGTLVLTAIVDITERKRAEVELQRNRVELTHLTRVSTIAELTASVAHELNQPLGAILSNAEAAEMFLEAEPPALDEVRDILADIRKDDQRASEVIRRMRGLLRKQEMAPRSIEINAAVGEVLKLLSSDASARKVAVKLEKTAGLPPVWCDPVHFQQVVLNLVLNGMEAMTGLPDGVRQIVIQTGPDGNGMVKVAVSDSGPGIAVESLAKLFEPFFTTKAEGMGMGLSIARTIVEAHHGQIWAENNSGSGATFYFTVPVDGNEGRGTGVEGRVTREPVTDT